MGQFKIADILNVNILVSGVLTELLMADALWLLKFQKTSTGSSICQLIFIQQFHIFEQEFPNTENNIKTPTEEIVSMSGDGHGDLFLSVS